MNVIESFTDDEIARLRKAMKADRQRATKSKAAAIASLKRSGFVDSEGRVAARYRQNRSTKKK